MTIGIQTLQIYKVQEDPELLDPKYEMWIVKVGKFNSKACQLSLSQVWVVFCISVGGNIHWLCKDRIIKSP